MLYFSYCKICLWHRLPVFLGRLYLQSSIKCLFASSHTTTETLQIPSMQVKTFCFVPFVNLTFDFLISVTRLGDFWTFSATKFIAKEAQMIGNFLGYFKKLHYYVKTALAAFRAIFGKKLGYFLLQHLVTLFLIQVILTIWPGSKICASKARNRLRQI